MIGYQKQIKNRIAGFGVEVADAGMVDNPVKADKAAGFLKSQDVEIVFLYVSTYALSSTVLPVAQKPKVPFVILNLQPVAHLDYAAFNASGDRGKLVCGYLQDDDSWREIITMECWMYILTIPGYQLCLARTSGYLKCVS